MIKALSYLSIATLVGAIVAFAIGGTTDNPVGYALAVVTALTSMFLGVRRAWQMMRDMFRSSPSR